ncbi:hypothetical protein GF389_01100, partial [Candidatus Dojkabacteria bacterium]|nr:hypothetical protein [Candidatus Dojkabacteria bacterium]
PITIVRNAVLMIKSKLEKKKLDKKELINYVDKAAEGAKRELDLVETLLSATKVESNRIQMTLTKHNLDKFIENAIDAHQHFADEKKLKVKYNKPKKDIFVYADKTRFQEVIDNLVSNAIKYTFDKGVEINAKEEGDNVKVAVKDHGIGISKEDMRKLGRKFYRAKQHIPNKTDKEGNKIVRPGGTGLGLYVAFNLMSLMNGNIEVESEVGKGSTFTVTIPKFKGQEDKQVDQTFEY